MDMPVNGSTQPARAAAARLDEEEYAVYAAIWQTDLFSQGMPPAAMQDRTGVGYSARDGQPGWSRRYARLFTDHTPSFAAILQDFEAKNAQPTLLERHRLPEGWKIIGEHTPRDAAALPGYFVLSRVGFNVEKTLALVYVGYRGATVEVDYVLLFTQREGAWVKVVQQLA